MNILQFIQGDDNNICIKIFIPLEYLRKMLKYNIVLILRT